MFDPAENEVLFIYNSNVIHDRESYSYIISLHEHTINEYDIYKNDLTPTQVTELANKLNVRIIDLFDRSSDYFKQQIEGKDLQEEDLLTILIKEKSALKTPIVITKKGATIMESSSEAINKDMIFTSKEPQDEQRNNPKNERYE